MSAPRHLRAAATRALEAIELDAGTPERFAFLADHVAGEDWNAALGVAYADGPARAARAAEVAAVAVKALRELERLACWDAQGGGA